MSVTTIKCYEMDLEVEYNYYYDPGVWTYPNGDPGYPESSELEITALYVKGADITKLLDCEELYDTVYEAVNKNIEP